MAEMEMLLEICDKKGKGSVDSNTGLPLPHYSASTGSS